MPTKVCSICDIEFELPKDKDGKDLDTNICGDCGQRLMDEEEAYNMARDADDARSEQLRDIGVADA